MSNLNEYLAHKRVALEARNARIDQGDLSISTISATVSAEGRSGVRRVRIRDHQVLIDNGADFAGYDLGASAQEILLGALGACVTHVFLIQAAAAEIPLDAVRVGVSAKIDPRGSRGGHASAPIAPYDLAYTIHVDSPASREILQALLEKVESVCPILSLLQNPQKVSVELNHTKR
ncbi:OsmC family protein [Ottowia thiooxydans]|uniref:OsmC family protein n=1 Tax=Ottowia thiooxydans TaxID=219182 RepID=UPI0004090798|nr:OsmC family protein [Ottowia thiooxydans]